MFKNASLSCAFAHTHESQREEDNLLKQNGAAKQDQDYQVSQRNCHEKYPLAEKQDH